MTIQPVPASRRLEDNSFDLLRLLFAGAVCLVHVANLSGRAELAWIDRVLSSTVAVKAFFVVSGFLVFMSFERSRTLAEYAGKRVRRIYPAYCAVVLLCAVGLAPFSSLAARDYFFSPDWLKYVAANLAFLNFLQPTLPGVFAGNPVAAVNGALWTLKIEAMFYLAVPVCVWLSRRHGRFAVLAAIYVASVAYEWILSALASRGGGALYAELARQLPGQMSYFVSGAFFFYYLPLLERRPAWFALPALLILVADRSVPLPVLEPFALATVVVCCGLFLSAGNWARYGDFSYGLYVLHFPIVQLLVQEGWLRGQPLAFLATAVALALAAAFCMWHLVELPFLRRDSHYVGGRAGRT
ncbi:MAG: acyltransferase [Rhodocyclaceae bacterium]|jgi:peptidoglycan/LPS O-acetylase OafA/YrhL|nr:hypothetical protein [Rhodocyclaceae bacterium]MCL4680498.1 acyltransferase [Rhodocyclaceae bacterium]